MYNWCITVRVGIFYRFKYILFITRTICFVLSFWTEKTVENKKIQFFFSQYSLECYTVLNICFIRFKQLTTLNLPCAVWREQVNAHSIRSRPLSVCRTIESEWDRERRTDGQKITRTCDDEPGDATTQGRMIISGWVCVHACKILK